MQRNRETDTQEDLILWRNCSSFASGSVCFIYINIQTHTHTQKQGKNAGSERYTQDHSDLLPHCLRSWVLCSRVRRQWVASDLCDKKVRTLLILWCPKATPCCTIPLYLNQESHPPPHCLSSCLSTRSGLPTEACVCFCVYRCENRSRCNN